MSSGVIYARITTTSGETIEGPFYVDDTGTPTTWIPCKIMVNTAGAPLATGSGANGATVLRVAQATDGPGVTTLGQSTASGSLPVVFASDQPAPSSGGYSIFLSLDLDETEEEIKASAGVLYKLRITNFATTTRYVKLYNATAANVTVGTTTPIDTIAIPPGSSTNPTVLTESYGAHGLSFGTALTAAATTALADADAGAPGANEVVVSAYYK